ncbi:MAG: ATP-binding cassette domain-containing protein [Betaproteobacteria bacterium]
MALLEVRNVESHYGRSQVLFGIDLTIEAGAVVTILGRNGMGKSTAIKTIMGMLSPNAGSIAFDGEPIHGWPSYRVAQKGIGLVPEQRQVFPNLSVQENLVATAANRAAASNPWTLARIHAVSAVAGTRAKSCCRSFRRRTTDAGDRSRVDDESAPSNSR